MFTPAVGTILPAKMLMLGVEVEEFQAIATTMGLVAT